MHPWTHGAGEAMAIGTMLISLAQVFAWTLVHSVWQGLASLVLYVLGRRLLAEPSRRYLLGLACLTLFVALQLCTIVYCQRWAAGRGVDVPLTLTTNASTPDAAPREWNTAGTYMPIRLPAESWLLKSAKAAAPVVFWIGCLWVMGFWFYLLRYAVASSLLRRELDRCIPLTTEKTAGFRQLAKRIQLERQVQFLETQELSVPATCGWLQPIVLLPVEGRLKFPRRFLDAIVLHELAHIRRRDSLTHRFRHLVESIYFFHPLVRWMGEKMTDDSEKAADEIAAIALGDKKEYANALLSLEEARGDSLKLGASGGSLKDRLLHVIASGEATRQNSPRLSALMVILSGLLLVMISSEVIVRGASPDQRLLAWVSDRNLPEAVLQILKIDTRVDRASPAIKTAVLEYEESGTVRRETLTLLADAIHAGIVSDLVIREWRGWIQSRGDMRDRRFPVIGSGRTRIAIAKQLTELAADTTDAAIQAHFARAAYALLALDIVCYEGTDAQIWILDPVNVALMHLDPDADRRINFAVALHDWRRRNTNRILSGLSGISSGELREILNAASYVPGMQFRILDQATPRDTELVRDFLKSAPQDIADRWTSLQPALSPNLE